MDILKQELAPINHIAWDEINEVAKDVFKNILSARKFIDVEGPFGWDFAAVNLGKLTIPKKQNDKDINIGIRNVKPLVEIRIPFKINIWDMDDLVRGSKEVEFEDMENAARKIAEFEESSIYYGLEQANIDGIANSSGHKPLNYENKPESFLKAITDAVFTLVDSHVNGPYTLVMNTEKWKRISSFFMGYPLKKQLKEFIDGQIILTQNVKDAMVVSERGGDFVFTLGNDISIGYHHADDKEVDLYFTESFTFRVIDPAAVVMIKEKA
jgi:uncharacterized linocin/CFP29 family protein